MEAVAEKDSKGADTASAAAAVVHDENYTDEELAKIQQILSMFNSKESKH